jgi:hypothetical protein
MNSTISLILIAILVLAAVAAVTFATLHRKRQSLRLKKQFGPEYDRAVERLGGQSKAEAELREREARIAKLNIAPLTADQAAQFSQAWKRVQGIFVDDPSGAVAQADKLVQEVMTARGYPMGDFERRASDISVDHPTVVEAYRAAQLIAGRDARGEADTEQLRKAFVHYRTLFAELLEIQATPVAVAPRDSVAVHT